jgi:hypothetical protein
MKHLSGTKKKRLTLSASDLRCIKWCVDASFAVHPDFKSHPGTAALFDEDKGAVQSVSRKHELSTKSSAEAELVAADDASVVTLLWTKLLMEARGCEIDRNMLHQDNKSAILLEESDKKSSGKRTQALNTRCFFLSSQVDEKGNVISQGGER